MAQFLRPISNVTQTNFTGGFAEIDESAFSDADFAYSAINTIAVLEVGLSTILSPGPGTRTVRYRLAQTNGAVVDGTGNTVSVTVALYQGTTLIATDAARTTSGTWTQYTFNPDTTAVTNWSDLRLRFTTTASGGGPSVRRGAGISWAEIETPDGALNGNETATANVSATLLIERALQASEPVAVTTDAVLEITNNLISAVDTTTNVVAEVELIKNLETLVDVTAVSTPPAIDLIKNLETLVDVTAVSLTTLDIIKQLESPSNSVSADVVAEVELIKNLETLVDVTAVSTSNLDQTIALSANVLGTSITVALGIADNPLYGSISATATSSVELTNIFFISATLDVSAELLVTMDDVLKAVSTDSQVISSITGNIVLDQQFSGSLNSSVTLSDTISIEKQLNQTLAVTVNTDAYLVQDILIFSEIAIDVDQTSNLLNASEGYIQGKIQDNLGNPIQRTIYLYRRSDGVKVDETMSNMSTGNYQFVTTPEQLEYMVVVKEENEVNYGNDQIRGRVLPYIGL